MSGNRQQPLLHDLLCCLQAPTQVWSGRDGQIRPGALQGVFHGDVRVVSSAVLTVDGHEPQMVMHTAYGATSAGVAALVRHLDGDQPDPTFRVDRSRVVGAGHVEETITLSSGAASRTVTVQIAFASDLMSIHAVNAGDGGTAQAADAEEGILSWRNEIVGAHLTADGADLDLSDGSAPVARWTVTVEPGRPAVIGWRLDARDLDPVVLPARGAVEWSVPSVRADDRRLAQLLSTSLDDLAALRMATPARPDDTFLAAGTPWFFTLFGRDSLWAARLMLPLGTELAAGTLRVLASRQGTVVDPQTEEAPGKILHEVRRGTFALRDGAHSLPPLYFGTVDATPLWVCLLHDAWRWGMPDDEVGALLPHLRRALAWMADFGDADGDGLLEYIDSTGSGLTNQGWKDSSDSVQWRDGRLAEAPIALAEVQGYAHEAALSGAAILAALGDGQDDVDRWREWAAALADRFRAKFWVDGTAGPYPAIALDAQKRPVDTLTSNIGHLLGTGLLNADETAAVARRLASPELDSGFGLRTMSTDSAGYWPLRYHGGTVWPHDTAIAVVGLARAGQVDAAAALAEGLLAAAPAFDYRLPELFGGDARAEVGRPVPYPAACRPQAWSAAAGVAVLSASLGLTPDVPGGTLRVRPPSPSAVGAIEATGLRIAGRPLDVAIAADGTVRSVDAPSGITVSI